MTGRQLCQQLSLAGRHRTHFAASHKRVELAWLSTETNHFGTDEFIDYCRELKVEPYFCINMGTGTYEEALAWLELLQRHR